MADGNEPAPAEQLDEIVERNVVGEFQHTPGGPEAWAEAQALVALETRSHTTEDEVTRAIGNCIVRTAVWSEANSVRYCPASRLIGEVNGLRYLAWRERTHHSPPNNLHFKQPGVVVRVAAAQHQPVLGVIKATRPGAYRPKWF